MNLLDLDSISTWLEWLRQGLYGGINVGIFNSATMRSSARSGLQLIRTSRNQRGLLLQPVHWVSLRSHPSYLGKLSEETVKFDF